MDKAWAINIIEEIALIGKGDRGITRLAFTEPDKRAREYIINAMRSIGLEVRTDAIGNIIGRLEGTSVDAPVVMTGSHLDTVPDDGKYDGVLGIAGALAAVKELKNRGKLTHPIEIVVFALEEPSRFGIHALGSRVMGGACNTAFWAKLKDQNGKMLLEELEANGIRAENLAAAKRDKNTVKAFIEMHIEQGGLLEQENCTIGIVENIEPPFRIKIKIEGITAHSGIAPMDDRADALVSAAMIILAIREIAMERAYLGIAGTVNGLKVYPGVMNVVPGLVDMWVDVHGSKYQDLIDTLQEIKDAVTVVADSQETPVTIEVMSAEKPVCLNGQLTEIIAQNCNKIGVSYTYMNSRAAHDAMHIAAIAPASMILLPCRGGICYSPEEHVKEEDIFKGIDVLTETLYQLAK